MGLQIQPDKWIETIKTNLGWPVVKLAITDDMIKNCIHQAILEIEPYLTEAELIPGTGPSIDLSKHEVQCVVRVWRQTTGSGASSQSAYDEFTLLNLYGVLGGGTFSLSSALNASGSLGSTYNSYLGYDFTSESAYSRVQSMQNLQGVALRNLYLSEVDALIPVDWRLVDDVLYTSGFNGIGTYDGSVVIEAITNKSLNHMTRTQENWVRNFATAKVKQIEGEIRSKVQIEGSPITLNGSELKSEGQAEEEKLREKLGTEIGLFFAMR